MWKRGLIFALLLLPASAWAQIPGTIQALDFGPPTSQVNCGVSTPTVAASTQYPLKAWVVPSPTNGHFYKATTAGTTGSGAQPTFATGSGSTTTWGGAVFTEQGSNNIKQCQDDVSLYVYGSGQIDGVTLIFNWSTLESSNAGCTAHANYDFSSMDTAINGVLNDSNFPAAAKVGVIFSGINAGSGPNTHTPCYVFSPAYAASLSTTTQPVAFCSSSAQGASYPGDGLVGTDVVYVASSNTNTDTTGYPWTPAVPYSTAWEAFQDNAIQHISAASYHARIVYQRIGVFQGGEVFPHCINLFKNYFSKTTDQIQTVITNYAHALYTHEATTMGAQTNLYPLMAGEDGVCVPAVSSCVIGYDWGNAEATDAASLIQGFGSQGLTQLDTIAFSTFGFADGGAATKSGTYCAGNFCYLFHQYPSAPIHELQTLAASCPQETTLGDESQCGGATSQQGQTGSLLNFLPLMKQTDVTHVELYNTDWLCAFDPNYLPCAPYAASYAAAITTLRTAQSTAHPVNLAESQPVSDALVTHSIVHRFELETLTTSDAIATQHNGFLGIGQALTTSDAITKQAGWFSTSIEVLATSAALVANFVDHTPSLNESLSTSDAIARQIVSSRGPSESLTTGDSLVRQLSASRFRIDSFPTSDALARQYAANRPSTDPIVTTDTIVANSAGNVDVTENITTNETTTDNAVKQVVWNQALAETITGSDALARQYAGAKALAETLSTIDTLTTVSPKQRSLAEPLSLVDSLARQAGLFRTPNDLVVTSDALSTNSAHAKGLTESLAISDAIARQFTHAQSLSDSQATSDGIARSYAGSKSLADSLSVGDVLTSVAPHRVALSEPLSVGDTLVRQYTALRSSSEAVTAIDALGTGQFGNFELLTETVPTIDALLRQYSGSQFFLETGSISDGLAAVPISDNPDEFPVDALLTSDAINRTGSHIPSPPIWLRVTQQGFCSVLAWRYSPSTTALSQTLYRSQVSGTFIGSALTTLAPNVETYTDCAVTQGQTYFYAVTASSATAEGGYSDEAQTTVASGVASPTSLTVIGINGTAALVWRRSPTIGVTTQTVYRGTTSGGPYTAIQLLDPTMQSFQDFTVTGGPYFYVVTASIGSQESPISNEAGTVIH